MKKTTTLTLKLFLAICIAAFSFNISSATSLLGGGGQDQPNTVDANGLRQKHWVILNSEKHLTGYQENDVVEEGDYKDNMKEGVWIQYYPGKVLKSKITWKDNRPEGYAITYFENGKVNEEGTWINNRWTGAYKLYYENGNVQHQFTYNDNGKRDGNQKYFYPNGQLMIDGSWNGGKQTGTTTEYYDDGSVKAKEVFNDGNLDPSQTQTFEQKNVTAKATVDNNTVKEAAETAPNKAATVVKTEEKPNIPEKMFNGEGYWKLYNNNKQLAKDGYFHLGRLVDGKTFFYSPDGILQRIAVYKDAIYQGDAPITDEDKK